MIKQILLFALIAISFFSCRHDREIELRTVGEITVLDKELKKHLNINAKIEVLADGFKWAEGPLWLEKRNKLIFSDVPKNTIYEWKEGIGINVFLAPSGYTGSKMKIGSTGSNGLALDHSGRLLLCQHGDRRVARMGGDFGHPRPNFISLANKLKNKKLNSPNDLAVHKNGSIYFTDPPYGLKDRDKDSEKELKFNGVYKIDQKSNIKLLHKKLKRPNGIAFSPDFKKCYVSNSDPSKPILKVFNVDKKGNLRKGRLFFDTKHLAETGKGKPDGIKVNKKGIVFATGPGGVLVIDPNGNHLGTISTGKAISNCAFDSKEEYLYMTSTDLLCRVKLTK